MCDDFWEKPVEPSAKKLPQTPAQAAGSPLQLNSARRSFLPSFNTRVWKSSDPLCVNCRLFSSPDGVGEQWNVEIQSGKHDTLEIERRTVFLL